jgi:hypothetical protein
LTAISVARQCNIVNQNQRVYLGDLSDEKLEGKEVIIWKDFDFAENTLNPETLLPNENESSYSEEEKDNNEIDLDDEEEDYDKCRKINLNNRTEINIYSKSCHDKNTQISPKYILFYLNS